MERDYEQRVPGLFKFAGNDGLSVHELHSSCLKRRDFVFAELSLRFRVRAGE
jgi:hypothetical protein